MNIKDIKINGELKYGDFPLAEYTYNEIVIEDIYGLKTINKEVKTILDVGGNLGIFSIFAREMFPKARIISIEAIPDTFALLQENVKNYNIETYNLALGDGTDLYFHQCLDHSGANSLNKRKQNSDLLIKSYKLKDLFALLKITDLSILKIDIEGGEAFLYQEDNTDLLNQCEYFTMEYHTANILGYIIYKPMWDEWIKKTFQNHRIEGLGGNATGGIFKIEKNE